MWGVEKPKAMLLRRSWTKSERLRRTIATYHLNPRCGLLASSQS